MRWEGDERGHGVANGAWIREDVAALGNALADSAWIAERVAELLLPSLQRAVDESDERWQIIDTSVVEHVLKLELGWSVPGPSFRQLRADVFALLGHIAESATFVQQSVAAESVHYRVTTGEPANGQFAPHGHLLELTISGPAVRHVVAGRSAPAG